MRKPKIKYPTKFFCLGKIYPSVDAIMKDLDCSRKAVHAYLDGSIDHPYRIYTKHIELNGVLYKSHHEACEALGVTVRNLRWYLEGTASDAIKQKIERKPDEAKDSRSRRDHDEYGDGGRRTRGDVCG